MPTYAQNPTILTLRIELNPQCKSDFAEWQAHFNSKVVNFPGFVSLEFLAPGEQQQKWLVVQRFSSMSDALLWQDSTESHGLMDDLKKYSVNNGIHETMTQESAVQNGVTEILITQVHPHKEQAYREWSAKIHQVEAKFPGFRGVYVQSPREKLGHWITLLQFDSIQNLDQWLKSSERESLLKESNTLISTLENNRIISPYIGWFASIAKVGEIPPVWKQTMLVLLVLFPIVMFELKFLSPLTSGLNSSVGTFIGNAISVTLIAYPMMPIALWFLSWWLMPKRNQKLWTLLGTLLLLILYLIEILLFWHFLS